MEAPASDGKLFCAVKHVTRISGGLCTCGNPAPRSQHLPRAREEPQQVHHPPAQFSATGVEGGVALQLPRGSNEMRQKTRRTAAENQEDLKSRT